MVVVWLVFFVWGLSLKCKFFVMYFSIWDYEDREVNFSYFSFNKPM